MTATKERTRKLAVQLKTSAPRAKKGHSDEGTVRRRQFCSMPRVAPRILDPQMNPNRARLIQVLQDKWMNGTVLEYSFLRGGTSAEHAVIRKAFKMWKDLGIGLDFKETQGRAAHMRIGFVRGDGAWAYVGRELLNHEHNMNFGWNIANDLDTALHEIGHALGFPHEHQNPNAGIVWNEEAVYADLAQPPNEWDRETTYWNIIRKIPANQVRGSNWDPNSIMHYPFGPGLIVEPSQYNQGLEPKGGLSAFDKEYIRAFYPPLQERDYRELKPFRSLQVTINPGQQINFVIEPTYSRKYTMQTIGTADTLLVLFEDIPGAAPIYLAGDDDGGTDRNARIVRTLHAKRRYILRLRLYYVHRHGECAVILS